MSNFNLSQIRKTLASRKIDGWLFYDFQGSDPIGRKILNLAPQQLQASRWYYYIPAQGVPVKLLHSFDRDALEHLPGKKEVYLSWQEMEDKLRRLFKVGENIAIQYSAKNAVPYLARIDAGTYELLKSFKIILISSGELIQLFNTRWTSGQLNMHINAAKNLYDIVDKTFRMINRKIHQHKELNELIVQKYIIRELKSRGLVFQQAPQVACEKNGGNPHYYPSPQNFAPIYPGSLIQIKLGAKERSENAVYAIISWVGYMGDSVPAKYTEIFKVICMARNKAIEFLDNSLKSKKRISGWQVDETVRDVFKANGYENYFLHRSGHSIGTEIFSSGANIDNYETRDEREIMHNTCFTLEPGLYFSEYGMRSGINVYVNEKGAHIYTQPLQDEIIAIIK
jgi:Xaa-Pro aminopeptidase